MWGLIFSLTLSILLCFKHLKCSFHFVYLLLNCKFSFLSSLSPYFDYSVVLLEQGGRESGESTMYLTVNSTRPMLHDHIQFLVVRVVCLSHMMGGCGHQCGTIHIRQCGIVRFSELQIQLSNVDLPSRLCFFYHLFYAILFPTKASIWERLLCSTKIVQILVFCFACGTARTSIVNNFSFSLSDLYTKQTK